MPAHGNYSLSSLNLESILADDKLNGEIVDFNTRQTRERIFLGEVDEVQKMETEKRFRVSEIYLGSTKLTEDEISNIMKQRKEDSLQRKHKNWKSIQSRLKSDLYGPVGSAKKAGAELSVSKDIISIARPHFDANKNDIWAKRMNTLRKFVSLTSRWIIRKRISDRMKEFTDSLHKSGAYTRQQVLEYIENENISYKSKAGIGNAVADGKNTNEATSVSFSWVRDDVIRPKNIGQLVCSMPNSLILKKLESERVISEGILEIVPEMMRRVLYPKFVADEASRRQTVAAKSNDSEVRFDDKTYFQLKVRPEYLVLKYSETSTPIVPITFPNYQNKLNKRGAPEEGALRCAGDVYVSSEKVLELAPLSEPAEFSNPVANVESFVDLEMDLDSVWLSTLPKFSSDGLNFIKPRPEFRTYHPAPARLEIDRDYDLRPFARSLEYVDDDSLRTSWLKTPGFSSANTYLMGSYETCDSYVSRAHVPPPPPGPTLADFYCPDQDRHMSGLTCFSVDKYRALYENDADVLPLQSKQAKEDHLTDSESDDEDAYVPPASPPILKIIKNSEGLLSPVAQPAGLASPAGTKASAVGSEGDFHLAEEHRTRDQVELLRDRKTLDMETYFIKQRFSNAEKIATRLSTLSDASTCLFHKMPIQLPFHMYEEEVYQKMNERIPAVSNIFVEGPVDNHSETLSVDTGSIVL